MPQRHPVRILLADDHAILRSGLRLLLEKHPDYKVVAEAETGPQALEAVAQHQPDLIVLDLNLPGLHGLDALPTLKELAPQARVLVLTMYDNPQYLRQALKRGAAGYLLKKAADSELLAAVAAILRGEVYVHPAMTRYLVEDLLEPPTPDQESDRWQQLSPREQEVLRLVALGYTSSEIAARLHLSSKTVDTYRLRGMEKLGLQSRAELVRFALQRGLLDPDL